MSNKSPALDAKHPTDAFSPDPLLRLLSDCVAGYVGYFEAGSLRCLLASSMLAAHNGHTPQSVLGKTLQEAVGDIAWRVLQGHLASAVVHQPAVCCLCDQSLPCGSLHKNEIELRAHFDAVGQHRGWLLLLHDRTDHWLAERAVQQSQERRKKFVAATQEASKVAAATQEAIFFHRAGTILGANAALQRLTGYPLAELVGRSVYELLAKRFHGLASEQVRRGGEEPYEAAIVHRDGSEIPVEIVGKTMPEHDGHYRMAVLRDLSKHQKPQRRETFLTLHDSLTQLPNRRHFMDLLENLLAQAQQEQTQAAVLFIDLDHFKTINDSLGHPAGDRLLCEIAARLRATVRDEDVVARLNGDQFAIVLGQIQSRENAAAVADKLIVAICQSITIDNTPLTLSCSIGVGMYPDDGLDALELLRNADAAMYHAKDSGRANRQFYAPDMAGRATEVLRKERLLRAAIAQHAFVLHYQPLVRLSDGALAGFEALVRWQHPERGLVGPDEFIGFAESRGLITPIGRWVLREACRQIKVWQTEGLAFVPVAVNLSALEFRQRDVAAELAQVLQESGLAPQFLEIELTESVLMHNASQGLQTLHAIKSLGVGISIDDFGTGYSSLAYLKRYPIDKLKIDRSFVMDTPGNSDDVAIVTAIVQMGHSLHLRTVAEGIETPEQMALMCRLGCDLAQGHGISVPLNAVQAAHWLRARIAPSSHCSVDM